MEVTKEMLDAAIKKADELKLFPPSINEKDYIRYWDRMKKILEAAINESKE